MFGISIEYSFVIPMLANNGRKFFDKRNHNNRFDFKKRQRVLSAIGHDKKFKAIFVRLVSKHSIKMKGPVAVQRKLLEMMFTLASKKEKYDKD